PPAKTRYCPVPGGPPGTAWGLAAAGPSRGVPPPPRAPVATAPAPDANSIAPTALRRAAACPPPDGPTHRPGHRRVRLPGRLDPRSASPLAPACPGEGQYLSCPNPTTRHSSPPAPA